MLVKAIFKGQNGSLGYETDKEYTLKIVQLADNILIEDQKIDGKECQYGSVVAFLNNWDNIRRVQS